MAKQQKEKKEDRKKMLQQVGHRSNESTLTIRKMRSHVFAANSAAAATKKLSFSNISLFAKAKNLMDETINDDSFFKTKDSAFFGWYIPLLKYYGLIPKITEKIIECELGKGAELIFREDNPATSVLFAILKEDFKRVVNKEELTKIISKFENDCKNLEHVNNYLAVVFDALMKLSVDSRRIIKQIILIAKKNGKNGVDMLLQTLYLRVVGGGIMDSIRDKQQLLSAGVNLHQTFQTIVSSMVGVFGKFDHVEKVTQKIMGNNINPKVVLQKVALISQKIAASTLEVARQSFFDETDQLPRRCIIKEYLQMYSYEHIIRVFKEGDIPELIKILEEHLKIFSGLGYDIDIFDGDEEEKSVLQRLVNTGQNSIDLIPDVDPENVVKLCEHIMKYFDETTESYRMAMEILKKNTS